MRTYDLTTASGRPYRTGEPSLAELKEQLIKTGRLAPSRLLRASRTYRQAGAVLSPRRRHKPLCLQPLCCHPPVLPLQQTPLALSEQLGIHQNTLRRYADEGRIQTIRTPPGQGRYDVDAFLRESRDATLVCYCRVSSAKLERRRLAKRNKYRAASRMRVRIGNLTDELHHQAARWLVDNFDVILLPTFETSDMARRGARKLRSKSVRSLLTYAHYRFQKFLTWKAWQVGKELVLVNEAYTSKTCSWSGEIIPNLGGRRAVAGSDGVRVDRDINGARGIFLRTLGDTPALRQAAQEYIGNCAVSVS